MKKKSYVEQIRESFEREFNNAKKQWNAEMAQKPFKQITKQFANGCSISVVVCFN